MKWRTLGLTAALSAVLVQPGGAVVQPKGAEAPVVAAGQAPRAHRTVAWSRASQLAAVGLPGWTALWDRDTDVPLRLWGAGVLAAGAMTDPAVAEAAARQFLAAHLGLLAPGAVASDFVVVANTMGGAGDVRSVGFAQRAAGVPVLGGAIGFSFKRDRLVMVSSTALPHVARTVSAATPARRTDQAQNAQRWLAAAGHAVTVRALAPERVIVPLVRPRGAGGPAIGYHLADQLAVEATTEVGRWEVWLDAATGAPIARKSTLHFASGRVLFDVPDRFPGGARGGRSAPDATHQVDSVATVATADGAVTWATGAPASVVPGLRGTFVAIANGAGALAADTLALVDGGEVTWSRAADELADAQLSAYVFASTAKQFARTALDPALPWLADQISVTVNENSTCNAYSTGDSIHFFRKSENCENTGRLADVVYHEFGHSLHANSIIEGVGQFDGALSEGMSDMFAALITRDSAMGRGFFFDAGPLRELEPATAKRWPDDVTGQVHEDGEIIGATMWDLRKALIAKLGDDAGEAQARLLYYGALQRSSDIPSTFLEVLVSDDDDGDLTNGTPNQCEIYGAFGAHGLADPQRTLGLAPPTRDGYTLALTVSPPAANAACPGPTVASAVASWRVRGAGSLAELALAGDGTRYAVTLPTQPTGTVVQYSVTLTLSDGGTIVYPHNAADPLYEFYVGEVEPLWCADFEAGATGWLHDASPTNRDEWEAGPPQGLGGDPRAAYAGTGVFGIDLANDGHYREGGSTWADAPVIDLQGHTAVRLQYRRWLGVEDGFFDRARVLANGAEVWSSYASQQENNARTHHIDREWRFHDIDLSAQAAQATGGTLALRFQLDSDQGLELGGWTLDDVCVVAARPAPACEADDTCEEPPVEEAAGCCSIGGSPRGALALSLLTLGLVLRRRRR